MEGYKVTSTLIVIAAEEVRQPEKEWCWICSGRPGVLEHGQCTAEAKSC